MEKFFKKILQVKKIIRARFIFTILISGSATAPALALPASEKDLYQAMGIAAFFYAPLKESNFPHQAYDAYYHLAYAESSGKLSHKAVMPLSTILMHVDKRQLTAQDHYKVAEMISQLN